MIRCIVHAFRDDGMLLHWGGRRVITRARQSLRGQVIGTGIRHPREGSLPSATIAPHRIAIIEASFRTRLMSRTSRSPGSLPAALASVDLASILGLAEIENDTASRTSNFDQDGNVHARTSMPALKEVDPPGRLQAPSPASASTRDTKAQGSYTWAFIFFAVADRLPGRSRRRHLSAMRRFPTDLRDR